MLSPASALGTLPKTTRKSWGRAAATIAELSEDAHEKPDADRCRRRAVRDGRHAGRRPGTNVDDSRRPPDRGAEEGRGRVQGAARRGPNGPAVVRAAARARSNRSGTADQTALPEPSVLGPRLTELAILT